MRVIWRLAIVLASLLLVNNLVFAQAAPCTCYDVLVTHENSDTFTDSWEICTDEVEMVGKLWSEEADNTYSLQVFGGGPSTPSFDITPSWTSWVIGGYDGTSGYMWTTCDGIFIFAQGHNEGIRYIAKGSKVPCDEENNHESVE